MIVSPVIVPAVTVEGAAFRLAGTAPSGQRLDPGASVSFAESVGKHSKLRQKALHRALLKHQAVPAGNIYLVDAATTPPGFGFQLQASESVEWPAKDVADMIAEVLMDIKNVDAAHAVRARVRALTAKFPLPY